MNVLLVNGVDFLELFSCRIDFLRWSLVKDMYAYKVKMSVTTWHENLHTSAVYTTYITYGICTIRFTVLKKLCITMYIFMLKRQCTSSRLLKISQRRFGFGLRQIFEFSFFLVCSPHSSVHVPIHIYNIYIYEHWSETIYLTRVSNTRPYRRGAKSVLMSSNSVRCI